MNCFRVFNQAKILFSIPFNSHKVNADVYGEQSFLLSQAHLQELISTELFHRLVLKVLEGISIVCFVHILGNMTGIS